MWCKEQSHDLKRMGRALLRARAGWSISRLMTFPPGALVLTALPSHGFVSIVPSILLINFCYFHLYYFCMNIVITSRVSQRQIC